MMFLCGEIRTMNELCDWLQDNGVFDTNTQRFHYIQIADQHDSENKRLCGHTLTFYLRRLLGQKYDGPSKPDLE